MPVEIRELVIKTEIVSRDTHTQTSLNEVQLQSLKQQIVQDCLKQIQGKTRRKPLER